MMADKVKIETGISWGYRNFLETFFKANDLKVELEERLEDQPVRQHTTLYYEENSDTAYAITFMSTRHLGFENMLCDYLIKCGIPQELISIGQVVVKNRNMAEVEKQWLEHRKKIGLR
jgi:hypothetical protein